MMAFLDGEVFMKGLMHNNDGWIIFLGGSKLRCFFTSRWFYGI